MKYYLFSNALGSFLFDQNLELVEKGDPQKLREKYQPGEPGSEQINQLLQHFKTKSYLNQLRQKNLTQTKQKIKESFSEDLLIIQAVQCIEELTKTANILTRRLRDWFSHAAPKYCREATNNQKFASMIAQGKTKLQEEMGVKLKKTDMKAITNLAEHTYSLYGLKEAQLQYIEKKMGEYCPNLLSVAGANIGGKLLQVAGSLKRLAELPSSTVQLLGAEKALFRHMKNKKVPPPKYGVIHEHQYISQAQHKGRAARLLADRISIAARVDYFKGEFIGNRLNRELEGKGG